MNAPAIEVEGLSRSFKDVRAVDDLTLCVSGPGVFGFLGPNGAGKTTAIRMLVGLIRPDAGHIRLLGVPASGSNGSVRRRIGYLPQDPAFYSWMTGEEYMLHTGDLFGLARAESRKQARELLDLCGIADAARRRVGGYSGGMKQRLGIAQALLTRPELLLLDEPVSALDPVGRVEVLELIRELGKEAAIFMSSHILADVERVCEEVAIIDRGRLLVHERTADLRAKAVRPALTCEIRGNTQTLETALGREPWLVDLEVQGAGSGAPDLDAGIHPGESGPPSPKRSRQFEDHATRSPPAPVTPGAGTVRLRLATSDLEAAEKRLPLLVAEAGLGLVALSPAMPSLEEVFIALVGKRRPTEKEAR